jgi:hypothetical protein
MLGVLCCIRENPPVPAFWQQQGMRIRSKKFLSPHILLSSNQNPAAFISACVRSQ